MQDDDRVKLERCFGVTPIPDICSTTGCDQPVATALPLRDHEARTSAAWYCSEHAASAPQEWAGKKGSHVGSRLTQVLRTCGLGIQGPLGSRPPAERPPHGSRSSASATTKETRRSGSCLCASGTAARSCHV